MAKIQTVNQLISVFKDIATRHYQINGFGIGDDWENGASEEKMHPVLWINPVTASMPESESTGYKTFEIDFEVRVFDLVSKGESNENDVLSDCIDILKDIILEFKGHPYYVNSQLNIIDDISFEAFTEEFDEEVSGWVCELSLMTPVLNSFCGIPAADITGFEFPGIDCPDVNVLCPVFVEDVTGVYPIVVNTVGTTKEVSIVGGVGSDTYVISGVYDTGTLTLTRNDAVDVVVTGFASGGDNDYTTAATLTGNIITFDRTDIVGAYSVDLTSAINSAPDKFVSSGAYDEPNNKIVLTLNDASTVDIDTSAIGGGNSIYTADGTIGAGRVATLTDTLKIEGGQTYIDSGSFNPLVINRKGSGALGNGIDFNAYNSSNIETNFARIIQVATDTTAGSEDGGLWFRAVINGSLRTPVILDNREFLIDAQYFTDNNFRVKDGTIDCLKVNANKQTYISSGGFNPLVLYTASNSPALGTGLDFNQLNSVNAEHNYGRIVSVITDSTNGSEDGGLWLRVSDNGNISTKVQIDVDNTEIKNKAILESTLDVYGTGTAGSSALTIYDNDTTPNKLWDFLDNGNVNLGSNSVVNQDSNVLQFSNINSIGGLKFNGTSNNGIGINIANDDKNFDFVVAGSSNTVISTGSLGLLVGGGWAMQVKQNKEISIGANFEPVPGYDLSVDKAYFDTEITVKSPAGIMQFNGYRSHNIDPSTATFPNDKDFGVHKNTSSGDVFLAFNDGGTIKKVQLT